MLRRKRCNDSRILWRGIMSIRSLIGRHGRLNRKY